MSAPLPIIALTPGEPAGIGPDLVALLAQESLPYRLAVVADPQLLRDRAELLGKPITVHQWTSQPHQAGSAAVVPITMASPCQPGVLEPDNATYVLACLDRAIAGCLAGEFDALVTGPVHKGAINEAGISFTGHTEYLGERTEGSPVMLLVTGELRVALATTHLALADVPAAITISGLTRSLTVLARDLEQQLGISAPRIAVCGLNPHAGESGYLGTEEKEIITPVIERLRRQGLRLTGPLSADTAFVPQHLRKFDAVLAMYHDQGLPVLKHQGFGNAVNVTLGLPILRTSVDHGVALDRAGTGNVELGSLRAALALAANMARVRQSRDGFAAA